VRDLPLERGIFPAQRPVLAPAKTRIYAALRPVVESVQGHEGRGTCSRDDPPALTLPRLTLPPNLLPCRGRRSAGGDTSGLLRGVRGFPNLGVYRFTRRAGQGEEPLQVGQGGMG